MTEDLAARLRDVEDRLALIELEGTYARLFDARRGDEWAALFTADGVYQSRGATTDGGGTFVQGRDRLSRFCTDAPFAGIHFMHLPQIAIAGDRATSRVHLEFIGAFTGEGAPVTRMLGFYDVSYVRHGARWLIARRVTTTFARHQSSTSSYLD